jgi:2-polyprenyl-3-methyl-5-hydroxy-6-metoxy-1,4-benzoquinol methylase
MNISNDIKAYSYQNAELNQSHDYLLPSVISIIRDLHGKDRRIFELGCGNGAIANELTKLGYEVTGIDPSDQGIRQANQRYPFLKLSKGSAYDDLLNQYGQFPIVLSLEVVEHVYSPRTYASTLYDLVNEGGVAIVSTPYHGYWKNLAVAITGKMDNHFTALWDHGHIKFWSIKTLKILLEEAGFIDISFKRVGRIPVLAKSMVAIAKKSK